MHKTFSESIILTTWNFSTGSLLIYKLLGSYDLSVSLKGHIHKVNYKNGGHTNNFYRAICNEVVSSENPVNRWAKRKRAAITPGNWTPYRDNKTEIWQMTIYLH